MARSADSMSRVLLCALGALLVLSPVACTEELPPDYEGGGVTPGGGGNGNGGNDGGTDGGLVIPSDGTTYAAKPSCNSQDPACAGACPDGGVLCVGNCGFLPPVTYAFAGDPTAVTVGDLNGDGRNELVAANSDGRSVAVLLNRQNGLFEKPSLWSAGKEPSAVALADLDADGKLDLLVANSADSTLGVYRSKGGASFQAPVTTSAAGLNLNDIAVGELTTGSKSVAVIRGADKKLSTFKVKADGTLETPAADTALGSSAYAMVLADFNLDGRPDVALSHDTACATGTDTACQAVGVLLNNGDGTFQAQRFTSTGGTPRGLVAARLDTDALMDLVVADAKGNQVLVLRGKGDGTFYTPVAYSVGAAPSRLVLADVNRDSLPDVLVTSATGNQVSVLLAQPGGTFASRVLINAYPQGLGLQGLAASDFDQDGFQDLSVLTRDGIQMLWGYCR